MNKESLRIRFDGPALDEHSIDVSVLGPSLTGLGELLKSANRSLNGDDVNVRVVMNADIEANCVTMDFTVLQGLLDTVRQLLGTTHVREAKEILEWIGLVVGGATGSTWTVWKLYQWLVTNRKPGEKIISNQNGDQVIISIVGSENQITINQNVYKLASDPQVQDGFKDLISPLKEEGIDEATFIYNGNEVVITKEAAKAILEASPADLDLEIDPQIIEGHIVIHAPIFDQTAKVWKFKWNGRVESINIANSSIASTILDRGRIVVGDAFKVRMEVIEKRIKSGYKQYFKVLEVIKFVPNPEVQIDLPLPKIVKASG